MVNRLCWLLLFVVVCTAGALDALAQAPPATLTPASPTPADVITARFSTFPCDQTVSTVVTGFVVTTTVFINDCVIITPPPFEETATFGPLPVGIYTYEIYIDDDDTAPPVLRSRQTFAVQAPPIPSLSSWGLIAMAAGLALVVLLRR